MKTKIDDLIPLLEPGWVAFDSEGRLIWFSEKPNLKKMCRLKLKNNKILIYAFDDTEDKQKDSNEKVEIYYAWSCEKGSRVVISDSLKSDAFKSIETVEDWKTSLRRVD